MLFSALLWRRLKYRSLEIITYPLLVIVVLVLLVTRVHYIIDIVGGAVFALWINRFLLPRVQWFDYIFTCIYNGIRHVYTCMRAAVDWSASVCVFRILWLKVVNIMMIEGAFRHWLARQRSWRRVSGKWQGCPAQMHIIFNTKLSCWIASHPSLGIWLKMLTIAPFLSSWKKIRWDFPAPSPSADLHSLLETLRSWA